MRFGVAGKRIASALLAGRPDGRRSARPAPGTSQGEEQKKLDVVANEILVETFDYGKLVSLAASEEMEEPFVYAAAPRARGGTRLCSTRSTAPPTSTATARSGRSSRSAARVDGGSADLLRSGHEQVAAGYVLFGPAVLLVYTTGDGAHLFTLDPSIGEFLLTRDSLRMPERGRAYAVNEGRSHALGAGGSGLRGSPQAARRGIGTALRDPLLGVARGRRPPVPARGRHLPVSRAMRPGEGGLGKAARPLRMPSRWPSSSSRPAAALRRARAASSTSSRTPSTRGSRWRSGAARRSSSSRSSNPEARPHRNRCMGRGWLGVLALAGRSLRDLRFGRRASRGDRRNGHGRRGLSAAGCDGRSRVPVLPSARVATTDLEGRFRLADLPPGTYRVAYRLLGFQGVVREDVAVSAGADAAADATLRLSVTADVLVTGRRTFRNVADVAEPGESLVGIADASTQGAVTAEQLELRPMARAGDVLETVPGVVISQHSGEGKANQYYLRGFNLDHGTDFATTVAGVPVNLPTHAHGHGYTDLNFVVPELVSGIQYKKGPYFVEDGDFTTAGSANINYVNVLDAPIARVDGGSYQYLRRPLRGFAEGRRRQSSLCDRRRLQQRPLAAGRRLSQVQRRPPLQRRRRPQRVRGHADGLQRELEIDRPGPGARGRRRLARPVRNGRSDRRRRLAALLGLARVAALGRGVRDASRGVRSRLLAGPLLQLHLLPRRSGPRRPVRAARRPQRLRPEGDAPLARELVRVPGRQRGGRAGALRRHPPDRPLPHGRPRAPLDDAARPRAAVERGPLLPERHAVGAAVSHDPRGCAATTTTSTSPGSRIPRTGAALRRASSRPSSR